MTIIGILLHKGAYIAVHLLQRNVKKVLPYDFSGRTTKKVLPDRAIADPRKPSAARLIGGIE